MRNKGFSLLEMLVAVCILSAAIILLVNGFGENLHFLGIAKDYTTAIFLAREKMVELENSQKLENIKREGDFSSPYNNFHWKISIFPGENNRYFLVRVKVSFTRLGLKREVVLDNVLLSPKLLKNK